MAVYTVLVGLGFRNPDGVHPPLRVDDEFVRIIVEAPDDTDAQLIACQMVLNLCDMPTSSEILEVVL